MQLKEIKGRNISRRLLETLGVLHDVDADERKLEFHHEHRNVKRDNLEPY